MPKPSCGCYKLEHSVLLQLELIMSQKLAVHCTDKLCASGLTFGPIFPPQLQGCSGNRNRLPKKTVSIMFPAALLVLSEPHKILACAGVLFVRAENMFCFFQSLRQLNSQLLLLGQQIENPADQMP